MDSQNLLTKRNIIGLIVALLLLISLPLGIFLSQQTQIFKPRASGELADCQISFDQASGKYKATFSGLNTSGNPVAGGPYGNIQVYKSDGTLATELGDWSQRTSLEVAYSPEPGSYKLACRSSNAQDTECHGGGLGLNLIDAGVAHKIACPSSNSVLSIAKAALPTVSSATCTSGALNISWQSPRGQQHQVRAKKTTDASFIPNSTWSSGLAAADIISNGAPNADINCTAINDNLANCSFTTSNTTANAAIPNGSQWRIWVTDSIQDKSGSNSDPALASGLITCGSGNVGTGSLSAADCQLTAAPAAIKVGEASTYSATFTAKNSSGNAVAGGPYGNIQVYKSDGTLLTELGNWSQRTSLETSFTPTTAGTYKVACRAGNAQDTECHGGGLGLNLIDAGVTNKITCPTSSSVTTVVVSAVNTADCTVTGPTALTVGQTGAFNATYSSNNLSITYGEINVWNSDNQNLSVTDPYRSWVNGAGKYSMNADAPGNNPTTGNAITFTPQTAGTYRVACRASNGVQTECHAPSPGITGGTIACPSGAASFKTVEVRGGGGNPSPTPATSALPSSTPATSALPVIAPTITSCTPSLTTAGVGESLTYTMIVNPGSFANALAYNWEPIDGLPVFEQTSANDQAAITGSFKSAGRGTAKIRAVVRYNNQAVKLDCAPVGIKVVSLTLDTTNIPYATQGLEVTIPIILNTVITETIYNVSALNLTIKYDQTLFDFISLDVNDRTGLNARCQPGSQPIGASFCKVTSLTTKGTAQLESSVTGSGFVAGDLQTIAYLRLKATKLTPPSTFTPIEFQKVTVVGPTPDVILGADLKNTKLEIKPRIFTKNYQVCEANGADVEWSDTNNNIHCDKLAEYKYYKNTPKIIAYGDDKYEIYDKNPGPKTIFVKFFSADKPTTDPRIEKTVINYLPNPSITGTNRGITCNFLGEGMEAIIYGVNFYDRGTGSVKINGQAAEITEWTNQNVTPPGALPAPSAATVGVGSTGSSGVGSTAASGTNSSPSPAISSSQGGGGPAPKLWRVKAKIAKSTKENVPIELISSNGSRVTGSCQVGVTNLDLSVLSKCGPLPTNLKDDVEITLFENAADATALSKAKVKVDGKGRPQAFTPPTLQQNKDYSVVVKSTKTLARKIDFKTKTGTTVLEAIDLPVGNIAPAANPDSKINSLDRSELIRQWALTADVIKTGDFNEDGRINSIDWSCMRENFNKDDESFTGPSSTTSR